MKIDRWFLVQVKKIVDSEEELARLEAVSDAEQILAGGAGELLALKNQPDGKTLVAVYREDASDGFIITAFLTQRVATLSRRKQLWP